VWHPVIAVVGGLGLVYAVQHLRGTLGRPAVSRWAIVLTGAYVAQLAVGSLNLFLLAPAPIQITHLLLADVIWIALVMLAAHALARAPEATPSRA